MAQATAVVIGGGPSGLMAAEAMVAQGLSVSIYDRMPSFGRKFLMAGRGGLNLTHIEPLEPFLTRYAQGSEQLTPLIQAFPPQDVRDWAAMLGEPTFVGTSGRVFPKSFKASPLLRAWLRRLSGAGVTFHPNQRFLGWQGGALKFAGSEGEHVVTADVVVLAMGGGSWARLGSDASFVDILRAQGLSVAPLQPSNCGFNVAWSPYFIERFAGAPLKTIALHFGDHHVRGEGNVTSYGLEGGAIYALSSPLRDAIAAHHEAVLNIDLRPDLSVEQIVERLARPRGKQSQATFLRKVVGIEPVAIALLREAGPLPDTSLGLAQRIKSCPITLVSARPMERAISTAGGLSFSDVDANLMITQMPGVFVAGEMLDWDAPTGGYLLQAALATGRAAGLAAAQFVSVGTL